MNQEKRLSTLRRFRIISIAEGISMIVLLFIAMPLKYGFDLPAMDKYTGWMHGNLYTGYVLTIFPTSRALKWSVYTTVQYLVPSI